MRTVISERENGRRRVQQVFEGESLTETHHQGEVNINEIVARYQRTGILPSRGGSPAYGDFTGVADYQSAVDAVKAADAAFLTLPPDIRKRFANDPGRLLAFLADPANRAEAEEIGLLERRQAAPAAAPAAVVEPPVMSPAAVVAQ